MIHFIIFQLWFGLGDNFFEPQKLESFNTMKECMQKELTLRRESPIMFEVGNTKCVPIEIGGKYNE